MTEHPIFEREIPQPDPRDEAFRKLIAAVRKFNQKPSLERRRLVKLAAASLTWAHELIEDPALQAVADARRTEEEA